MEERWIHEGGGVNATTYVLRVLLAADLQHQKQLNYFHWAPGLCPSSQWKSLQHPHNPFVGWARKLREDAAL